MENKENIKEMIKNQIMYDIENYLKDFSRDSEIENVLRYTNLLNAEVISYQVFDSTYIITINDGYVGSLRAEAS